MGRHLWIIVIFSRILLAVPSTILADAKIDEQDFGPVGQDPKDVQYVVSPHGGHLASVAHKGSRMTVIVDGVAGPRVDEIVTPSVAYVDPRGPIAEANAAGTVVPNIYPIVPVTFSKDGKRFAYLGRIGQESVLMADNKEVLRLPASAASTDTRMEFTGGAGKHLMFARASFYGFELWVDGQKWPGFFGSGGGGSEGTIDPIVSPDGEHIAYVAQIDREKRALIVNGKDAGYFGYDLRFTPDSKHLISLAQSPKGMALLVDGKPLLTAGQIAAIYQAPVGNRIAAVVMHENPDQSRGQILLVDGKPVEASLSQQIKKVVFSPDGKRYAAVCGRPGAEFVVTDGKKGQEYFSIDEDLPGLAVGLRFSADSTQVGYVATIGTKKFIVINDDESDGFENNAAFLFSSDGKHVVMTGMQNARNAQAPGGVVSSFPVYVDGKAQRLSRAVSLDSFAFSPDHSRYAYGGTARQEGPIYLDGKDTGLVGNFTFSPDSKHLTVVGFRSTDNKRGLFVDGQFVYAAPGIRYRAFTPDGQHLYWMALEPSKSGEPGAYDHVTYLDGKPVARCDRIDTGAVAQMFNLGLTYQYTKTVPAWDVGTDGVLTFLGPVGDSVKRFKVTPSSDTSVATLVAGVNGETAPAKSDTAKPKPVAATPAAGTAATGVKPPPNPVQTSSTQTNSNDVVSQLKDAADKSKAAADSFKRLFGK